MLESTRIRSIAMTAFPAWPGGKQGHVNVAIQRIDESGKRTYQDMRVEDKDLWRVVLAQRALLRRVEG